MDIETKRLYFNATTDRVLVEIRSAPCAKRTVEARAALVEILQNCVLNQNLLHCDAELMESATIRHDGTRWVLRTEALVLKKMES
jgi:hypothetical protein